MRGVGRPVMNDKQFHEDYSRIHEEKKSTERSLGIVFAVACVVIGALKLWNARGGVAWLIAAGVFLFLALCFPIALRPLNLIWRRIGQVLFSITNPIIMGVVFFAVLAPLGLMFRLLHRDVLRLKKDAGAESYWWQRDPPGPDPQTMKNQF